MSKELKILIKFALYFLTGFIILFYGITHKIVPTVLAETVDVGYVSSKTTVLLEIPNSGSGAPITLPQNTTNTYGQISQIYLMLNNQQVLSNYKYMLEMYTPDAKLTNVNQVLISGGTSSSTTSTTCQSYGITDMTNGYPKIYFSCPSNLTYLTITLTNVNGITSGITTANNFRWSYTYLRYYTEDNDIDLGPIISNQTNNTNDIINNQNENTQSTNDTLNNQLGDKCNNLLNYKLSTNGAITYNSTSNNLDFNNNSLTSAWFEVKPNTKYTIVGNYNRSRWQSKDANNNITFIPDAVSITTNSSAKYLRVYYYYDSNVIVTPDTVPRIQVNEGDATVFCEYGSYSSKLDTTNKQLDEQNKTSKSILGKIGDLFNSFTSFVTNLFSTDGPNTNGLGNVAGWLPAGPVDSILTLPLSLINAILNGLGSSCTPLQLPLPFVSNTLTIPCINTLFSQITGVSTLYSWFGPIVSAFILYYYFKSLYKWIDEKLSLKEDSEWGGV